MSTPPVPYANENREDITFFVAAFTLSIATIAVSLRIYTRKILINQLGIDDYCAITAMLLVFSCDFAVTYNTNFGLGRHIWTVPPEWIPLYLRAFYVSIVLYNASLMVIKMTFLSQYYRIFQHSSKTIRRIFAYIVAFVVSWTISQLLIAVFTCHPIDAYWDVTKKADAVCIPDHPFWEINAAGNIVTDVMVLVLPIPIIEKLNLPRRQRHILVGIFGLGLFTVGISLIRIRFLKQYEDFTWENVESSGWSMGELASGLTCSCLPTLRPLVGHYMPWMSSTAEKYKRYRHTGGHTKKETDLEHGRPSGRNPNNTSESDTTRPLVSEAVAPVHIRDLIAAPTTSIGVAATTTNKAACKDSNALSPPSSASGLFTNLSCGLQRLDNPSDSSDDVVGLRATRDALDQEAHACTQSPLARRASLGPAVSAVARAATPVERPLPMAIQVKCEVYQTNSEPNTRASQ